MKRLFIYFFIISSLLSSQDFNVEVSNNKVGLNESFEITFILNDNGKKFTPPPFSDFQILRGPSKSSSTSIINGALSQEMSYTYVLKPKKTGVFTILPATITVKNKTIGTNPTTIQVQKSNSSNQSNTPYGIVSRKVHLTVSSDKETCYLGEPLVLTYKLYFNLNIGSLSPNSIKYGGFWAEDVDVNTETKKATYKGSNYNTAIIKQVVLIPQVSGKQKIDPFSLDLVASLPNNNRRDFFNMLTTQSVNYTVVSNELSINVLDLPNEGKPLNFSGAIGDFDLIVDLSKDSINVNESATFSVKIVGQGNLSLISSPQVRFNSEIEVFDPQNNDKIRVSKFGMQGYKKEDYLIVPRYKGNYNLRAIEFNYFNPKTKKYIILQSKNKTINVGGAQKNDESYTFQSINKEKIDLINEDIKFIKTNYSSVFLNYSFLGSLVFFMLIFLAVVVFLLAFLYQWNYLDIKIFTSKNLLRESMHAIKKIEGLLVNKKYQDFQSKLLIILLNYVGGRFSIEKSDLSAENISLVLSNSGVPKSFILEYLDLVKYLEKCKYSLHVGDQENQNLYTKSIDLLNKIDVVK